MVGFNNSIIGKVIEPKLTSIKYHGFEKGQFAARTLIGHLKDPIDINITSNIVINSELIIRES